MASGLPAIGSRVGGIGETIEDGVTGLLVSPNNPEELATAIIRLVNDSPLRRQMGRAGQLVARQKYSWTALATEVADVYQQFIPARRHSAGRANRS
jgi:glycosyltransferase involved in cell wall biosynthesis